MKKLQILSVYMAAVMAACALSAPAFADTPDKYYTLNASIAGVEFDSAESFFEFLKSIENEKKVDGLEKEISDYLTSTDFIFIPQEFSDKTEYISKITITPTYANTMFYIDDVRYEMYYYFSQKAGGNMLNEAKSYVSEGTHSAEKLKNGVYCYERSIFDSTECYYLWKENNNHFVLRINASLNKDYEQLCTIEEYKPAEKEAVNANLAQSTAIKTAEDLMSMKADGTYHLENDIDLSGVKWRSISGFKGTFNGNGYEIKNLTSKTYGLFSSLKSNAVVTNVKLTNVNIMSKYKTVGAVASLINSSAENVQVENCFVSGIVASCRKKYNTPSSSSTAGAIVGKNSSESSVISYCYSNAVVCAEKQAGGIVGINKGAVTNSGFGGTIENSQNVYELACDENGEKTDDYTYMYSCGGICGINYGTIENCLSDYTDKACATYVGGIAGRATPNSKISDCVNLTKIWLSDDMYCGFIAGYASKKAEIKNCYTREADNTTTLDNIGKTVGKFSINIIPVDELGNEESFAGLCDCWGIRNGKPAPYFLADYLSLERIFTIKGGKLAE